MEVCVIKGIGKMFILKVVKIYFSLKLFLQEYITIFSTVRFE